MMKRHIAFAKIEGERNRQIDKFGKEPLSTPTEFISILGEEFGEVCRAINQDEHEEIEKELIQTMAVCLSWLEYDSHYGRAK